MSHAVGCAFAACLERKQRREKECGVTASFDASRTSFVREGSFRISSAGQQSDREDIMKQLQDKKKGQSHFRYSQTPKAFFVQTTLISESASLQKHVAFLQCHLEMLHLQRERLHQGRGRSQVGLTPSRADTPLSSSWCGRALSEASLNLARRTHLLNGSSPYA